MMLLREKNKNMAVHKSCNLGAADTIMLTKCDFLYHIQQLTFFHLERVCH